MKDIKILGIDLAKNVFQVHGANAKGQYILHKRLTREKLTEWLSNIPPCLIGIEACMGAHYWARVFTRLGHTVKMMSPQFVKPYVRANKNDRNDARGIAEAVTRPDMKFVSPKTIEQQDILLLHRARELVVKQKTAQSNQIRGLLAEYGIIIPQGANHMSLLLEVLEKNSAKLTERSQTIFKQLYEHYKVLDKQLTAYTLEIECIVKQESRCQAILKVDGIGVLTASAFVATLGDPHVFKNGREVSAWLGLVPRQHSSGNKIRLLGISKRGDRYLRTLLIHGARAVLKYCDKKTDQKSQWLTDKKQRCGYNKAAVALDNKNVRTLLALLASGECYCTPNTLTPILALTDG